MNTLRLASFGIRGVVGGSLSPQVCIDFASAFATYAEGGRILIGRDTRSSSGMLHSAVVSGLLSAGCEVIDFGICPTPILQFSVPRYQAVGGVSISGGHTGMGWNAITLLDRDGAFLDPVGGENVLDFYHAGHFLRADWQQMGEARREEAYLQPYLDALTAFLDVEAIRAANFTVLIDPVAGAGCEFLSAFADCLGFKLVPVNAEPSGYLPRDPEPRPRTARHLSAFIKHVDGAVGFALSSDMGRMSVVTETGETASEEYTFPLIASHLLAKTLGPVVTNCCTTRTVDDLAERCGVRIEKTPVGQAWITSRLADVDGVIGGEGSGSAMVPAFSRAFDGFLMMGILLEAMAVQGRRASELLSALPHYHIIKNKVDAGSTREAYAAQERLRNYLVEQVGEERLNLVDGVRADWDDGWVHVRVSRTQQMMRIISEAVTRERAEELQREMARVLA